MAAMKANPRKRAAHFLLSAGLAHSPPNDALVNALLNLDYQVALFAPGGSFDVSRYGGDVRSVPVLYGYRWLITNALSHRWMGFDLFSGTTEDPMAVAGTLARIYRKPCVTMADEIKNGSFAGNRSRRWKQLCRSGMRASSLTVVNEQERIPIQRKYAGLPAEHPFVVYPGCFYQPPPAEFRSVVRDRHGIPRDALVVCYSGILNEGNGGLWLASAVTRADPDVWFWAQVGGQDALTLGLLRMVKGGERLRVEDDNLSWEEAWRSMGGVDIGIVAYLQDADQFRHMGTASNRLCMFLSMGIPVVATKQPSFEFVERYQCGILVDNKEQLVSAISHMKTRLAELKQNALRCAKEYIAAPTRFRELESAIGRLGSARSHLRSRCAGERSV